MKNPSIEIQTQIKFYDNSFNEISEFSVQENYGFISDVVIIAADSGDELIFSGGPQFHHFEQYQ